MTLARRVRARLILPGGMVLVASLAACAPSPMPDAPLPYYDEATFTPRWTPVAHRVGPFSLQAQTGARFSDADVLGRVHVVSFVYTACPNICPRLMASLKRVESRTRGSELRLVSYSVTPETDTPEVLAAFGRRYEVPAGRWTLATGARAEIARLARERYFAMDARSPDGLGADPLLHSEVLLLVDRAGRIRGVYNGLQPADLEHLVDDALLLANWKAS